MSYTREQLVRCEGASIPDLLGDDCRLLFVGINPGLQTAMTGIHFAHPSNRFWPALRKAGIIDWVPEVGPIAPSVPIPERLGRHDREPVTAATNTHFCHPSNRFYPALRRAGLIGWELDPDAGMSAEQRADLVSRGIGITNLVASATARASELQPAQLRQGALRLAKLVVVIEPKVVAVAGVTAYRTAFSRPRAILGRQNEPVAGSETWVVPNPSGLNAHETVATLAEWYRRVADAAGVD